MMERDLPEGWIYVRIGDAFMSVKDKIEPEGSQPYKYVGLEHLAKGGGIDAIGDSASLKSTKTLFKSGDVLYGKLRPYLNKRAIVDFDGVCSTDILVFRGRSIDSSKFLYYYLGTNEVLAFANENSQGINLPRVSGKVMENLMIPLPPLAEQKRIVAKLDAAFAHLEKIKANLARIPELLKRFREAVLTQAVTGKLTKERGKWNTLPISQLSTKVGSGSTPKGGHESYLPTGIPLIRSMNVHFSGIKYEGMAFIDEVQAKQLKNVEVWPDDVLLNITGASIGRVCLAPPDLAGARVNQHVAIIRVQPDRILPKFLAIYISSQIVQRFIHNENYGVTRQALTKAQIMNFSISFPTLDEQQHIISRVSSLFSTADAIESQYNILKEKIDNLPQALLAKAFRGELVPQDPDDEPAAVLLEKIRNEMGKLGKKGKKQGVFDLVEG